jgi:hypothetical protein
MKISKLGSLSIRTGFVCAAILLAATVAPAAQIQIGFTGMNLVYDGSNIYDAGSNLGGTLNPANADPVASADFFIDSVLVGNVTSNVSVDIHIPDVTNIPSAPNTVYNVVTPGNPGIFDLLIGTSPSASQYLALDLGEVSISYLDVAGIVQFHFGAAVAEGSSQNLPFGLQIGDPVTLSFSTQIDPGSRTIAGGFVTGFRANGTGEIRGEQIPEPSSIALCVMGAMAIPVLLRRRRR